MSKFMLVDWINETPKQFSVVSVSSLEDGTKLHDGIKLIGQTLNVMWKSRACVAKILEIGSESKLLTNEKALAEAECQAESEEDLNQNSGNCRRTRKRLSGNTLPISNQKRIPKPSSNAAMLRNEISTVLEAVANEPGPVHGVESRPALDVESEDWKKKYEELLQRFNENNSKCRKYKDKLREKKALCKLWKAQNEELTISSEQVELVPGTGVFISESKLSTLKLISTSAAVLARNLFRSLYSLDEICGHSLEANRCNANGDRYIPLPAVDGTRRDAIIGFALSSFGFDVLAGEENRTIEEKRVHQKKCKMTKREIKKSLSDFLREETRKYTHN